MENKEIAQIIIDRMNDALTYDREAVMNLVEKRVTCNEKMADHPSIQVVGKYMSNTKEYLFQVGLLGILNGIAGVRTNGWGYIAAEYDDDGMIQEFVLLQDSVNIDPKE